MTAGQANQEASPGPPAQSLRQNRDFGKYLVGYTASDFASQIGTVAIPLVAVLTVGASSFEVGVMRSANQVPYLLFVLAFGIVVDQVRRRNLLAFADLGRALALAAIPAAFALDALNVPVLYLVSFLIGVCTVLFDVGSQAYLPRLVERDQLTQGNSLMESLRSTSLIAGPAVGGLIVGWFSPPNALIACAAFYLISAGAIWWIRKPEPKPEASQETGSAIAKIGEGFRLVFGHPILRSVVGIVALFNFTYAAYLAVYIVYLPVELKLPTYAIGLAFAATGPGFLVGAVLSSWLPKRFGYGLVLNTSAVLSGLFALGVALLHGNGILTIALLLVLQFVYATLSMTFTLPLVAIRQSITPDRILGRVTATHRFLGVGLGVPLGSLAGGFLGEQLGLRNGLFVAALAMIFASSLYLFTALRTIGKELPEPIET
ncbi:MFS transporter [Nonomuraea sp. K274]|uniref:MFS transporter n=1 Tax=Nonomuraea cypriaca TaxID=1187855 RepID=A0A931EYW9_9ACTN|nr:MFS transporter [Nonomuraea cypriaca]MBF8184508.1 MFS transporter [Nonomuraea cypriaca]